MKIVNAKKTALQLQNITPGNCARVVEPKPIAEYDWNRQIDLLVDKNPAPQLRHAHAPGRLRHPYLAGTPRPQRRQDDNDLHTHYTKGFKTDRQFA